MKIGIIGNMNYFNRPGAMKLLDQIRKSRGICTEIVTGGNTSGIEYEIRKTALEMGFRYSEFNPAYSARNSFSVLNEDYYNRPFHPTHDIGRYRKLVDYVDCIITFGYTKEIKSIIKYANRKNKKIVSIQ